MLLPLALEARPAGLNFAMNTTEYMSSFSVARPPGAGLFVPLDCMSRRAQIFVTHSPHRLPALARIVRAVEANAARDPTSEAFLAIDDFAIERVMPAHRGVLTSAMALEACRHYVARRGVGWPGDKPALAHLAIRLRELFGAAKSHSVGETGARQGWRGVALLRQ